MIFYCRKIKEEKGGGGRGAVLAGNNSQDSWSVVSAHIV